MTRERRASLVGVALAAAALAGAGCYDAYSNDNIIALKSLPRGLRIEVPSDSDPTQGLRVAQTEGTPARFHADAVKGAQDVNQMIEQLFAAVDHVSALEPTVQNDTTRIWGPIPVDNDQEVALVINHVLTATVAKYTSASVPLEIDERFDYAVLSRPQGTGDDAWRPVFGGQSVPVPDTRLGTGSLAIDMELLSNGKDRGLVWIVYDTQGTDDVVEVAFDVDRDTMAFDPDAAWRYTDDRAGGGTFFLILSVDEVKTTPARETIAIASRWLADTRGRADVAFFGGDLGPFTFTASECWNAGFERVYFFTTVPDAADQNVGEPSDCAPGLETPQFPD